MSNESKRFLHFNSCVYELTVSGEGKDVATHSLMRQKNNTLLFEKISVETLEQVNIKQTYLNDTNFHGTTLVLYPWKSLEDIPDEPVDAICITGTMLQDVPVDRKTPIIDPGTPEGRSEAIKQALLPRYRREHTRIFVPITEKLMFDLAISHVPPTAITYVEAHPVIPETPQEEDDAFAGVSIDPTAPTLSNDERKLYGDMMEILLKDPLQSYSSLTEILKPDHPVLKNSAHLEDICRRMEVLESKAEPHQRPIRPLPDEPRAITDEEDDQLKIIQQVFAKNMKEGKPSTTTEELRVALSEKYPDVTTTYVSNLMELNMQIKLYITALETNIAYAKQAGIDLKTGLDTKESETQEAEIPQE